MGTTGRPKMIVGVRLLLFLLLLFLVSSSDGKGVRGRARGGYRGYRGAYRGGGGSLDAIEVVLVYMSVVLTVIVVCSTCVVHGWCDWLLACLGCEDDDDDDVPLPKSTREIGKKLISGQILNIQNGKKRNDSVFLNPIRSKPTQVHWRAA